MKKHKQKTLVRRATGAKSRPRVLVRRIVQNLERPIASTPKDMVEARKSISEVVRGAAIDIIGALVEQAEQGEVAPAKYLFEMVGLYPATEEASSKPEDSLAYTLLQRMGLPPDLDAPGQTPTGEQ